MQEEVLGFFFPPVEQPILMEGANCNLLEPTSINHSAMLLEKNSDPWAALPTQSTGLPSGYPLHTKRPGNHIL